MLTLNPNPLSRPSLLERVARILAKLGPAKRWPVRYLVLGLALLAICGCRKDIASEASDSDANGYLCLKCGAKLFTARSVFIGPQCPKCQANELTEVVGYACEKDNHLTILPRALGRQSAPVCDQCQAPVSAMRLPRQKDLKVWGAIKVP